MRFHVVDAGGRRSYESAPGTAIVVELTEQDVQNISNMAPDATTYAVFQDTDDPAAVSKALDEIKERDGAYVRGRYADPPDAEVAR